MEPSLTNLATRLDAWAEEGSLSITETDFALILDQADASSTAEASRLLAEVGWTFEIEDSSQSPVDVDQVTSAYAPYRVTAHKPTAPADTVQLISRTGLAQWFARTSNVHRVWAASLQQPFETFSVRVSPWGDMTSFRSRRIEADARRAVREIGPNRVVEGDVSRWLLRRDSPPVPWDDPTFKCWADLSAVALLRVLATEIAEGDLVFRGPPTKRLKEDAHPLPELERDGFWRLQECALWVLENEREHEMRHALFATEFSRTVAVGSSAAANLRKDGRDALEGAKIAYQLGLSEISRDSLRAMSDLRKAVSDEAIKLSDTTRQLATAVAGAMFGGIGLVVARLTVPTPGTGLSVAIVLVGVVLATYVLATIYTGVRFMRLQRKMRNEWRSRLYRFLPEADYRAMVQGPAADAEGQFTLAAWVSGILTAVLFAAFCILAVSQ